MCGRGGDGNRQVDIVTGHQRARTALQRRSARRYRHRGREDNEGQSSPRSGGRRWLRRAEPAGHLRDRNGRGRVGLHHGESGCASRCHASACGRCSRPARPPGSARSLVAGFVGWTTATRGHRGGADGIAPHAGAGRADVSPRSGRSRRGPGFTGPTGARSRSDRRHGRAPARACGAVCRPDRPRARRRCASPRGLTRGDHALVLGRTASGRAGPPGRLASSAAHGPRRSSTGRPFARAPGSLHAPRPDDGARPNDRSGRGGRDTKAHGRVLDA